MEYSIVDKDDNVILKFNAEKITDIFTGEKFEMFYNISGTNGEIKIDTGEYEKIDEEKVYKEGFEEGYQRGYKIGNKDGYKTGRKVGEMKGHEKGYSEGFEEGYNEAWNEEEESFFIKTGIDTSDPIN